MNYLSRNLEYIKQQITDAEHAAGRVEGSAKLLAVSKNVDHSIIQLMSNYGQNIFAESRPQILRDKVTLLTDSSIKWHFIGPLQNNKIKYVYPVAELVHSIDRRELLDKFVQWHDKTGHSCPVLLEVHISDEVAKRGFKPDEVLEVIKDYKDSSALDIQGLMGMAPFVDNEEVIRDCFRQLKGIFEKSKTLEGKAYRAKELSMGMSGDFKIAIEEGATIVRIGTALFKESEK